MSIVTVCKVRPARNSAAPTAGPKRRTAGSPGRAAEIRQLLRREIAFIPNACFYEPDAEAVILRPLADLGECRPRFGGSGAAPALVTRLCEAELLPPELESALFRGMNYLKSRAHALRSRLNPQRPEANLWQDVERCLADAQALRNRIVQANLRLVVAIVRDSAGRGAAFDDLLSAGIVTLISAVEKFDYARGFRFSTYAYRAITREVQRVLIDGYKQQRRCVPASGAGLEELSDERHGGGISELAWNRLRSRLAGLLGQLDRRQQLIIRARFALGAHRRVRTLQSLADRLGVSRERIRQLEREALEKLRDLAAEEVLD